MGSINDYGRRKQLRSGGTGWSSFLGEGWKRRLLLQAGAALLLFLLVAAGIDADNLLGRSARYIAVSGISPESSWLWSGLDPNITPVSASEEGPLQPQPGTLPEAGTGEGDGGVPQFTAPASGVVVTDLAVAVSGFPTELGILIQGSEGQSVKAAAEGSVRYLGESEDGYIIELCHAGGFSSIYQGLSQVGVTAGQELRLGEVIGATADGEVTFTLLLNDEEVNPLEYLF
ncbi:MAG: M23 family metallopeptidase [Bacillota bacterium]|nr:M23 family metallopeptidase [Bacillota bacterium]